MIKKTWTKLHNRIMDSKLKTSLLCLVVCLVCVWLSGCAYSRPMNEEYQATLRTQQTSDMNCVDRGVCYNRVLRSEHYQTRVISGHLYGSKPNINHLWIEHFHNGHWYNTETEKRVDKTKDRTRELEHDYNITKHDVIMRLKQKKLSRAGVN